MSIEGEDKKYVLIDSDNKAEMDDHEFANSIKEISDILHSGFLKSLEEKGDLRDGLFMLHRMIISAFATLVINLFLNLKKITNHSEAIEAVEMTLNTMCNRVREAIKNITPTQDDTIN